jgi:hypothetical protein
VRVPGVPDVLNEKGVADSNFEFRRMNLDEDFWI